MAIRFDLAAVMISIPFVIFMCYILWSNPASCSSDQISYITSKNIARQIPLGTVRRTFTHTHTHSTQHASYAGLQNESDEDIYEDHWLWPKDVCQTQKNRSAKTEKKRKRKCTRKTNDWLTCVAPRMCALSTAQVTFEHVSYLLHAIIIVWQNHNHPHHIDTWTQCLFRCDDDLWPFARRHYWFRLVSKKSQPSH